MRMKNNGFVAQKSGVGRSIDIKKSGSRNMIHNKMKWVKNLVPRIIFFDMSCSLLFITYCFYRVKVGCFFSRIPAKEYTCDCTHCK